ncbi:uncharacterized protein [Primulina eburnea]|uniref:uncharacterized protein n=1 Tax=Primulina eburnea TaxID=1245227 RepID=UPI003C6BFF78
MPEADVILGMDWLMKNRVLIDFQRRSMLVRPLGMEQFLYEPDRWRSFPRMISCMQAQRLIRKGFHAFLANIISTPNTHTDIIEYPDVFRDDITGLPPEREVEFAIDLVRCNVPISNAPYQLAPAEMLELKQQIQELLDKEFIDYRELNKVTIKNKYP